MASVAESSPAQQLAKAVAQVADGSTVGFGGYFQSRHPMAAIREIVRQGKKELHIVTPLGGIDTEMLLAAGVATKITFGFISMDVFGQSPSFRKTIESGLVEAVEYGDLALIRAMEAAERGLPWLPTRAWIGSDIEPYHPGSPFDAGNGEHLWKVPALKLDWALVHVPFATEDGDLVLIGEGYDALMVKSASHVIATAEQLVPKADIAARWSGRTVARYTCDHVIELPYGAHPSGCFPFYVQDVPHLLTYMNAIENGFDSYRNAHLQEDETSYLSEIGATRLLHLRQRMSMAMRVAESYR